MSLVVPLGINSLQPDAGLVVVRRLTGTDDPDSLNRYAYELTAGEPRLPFSTGANGAPPRTLSRGEVTHRYGDGAFRLLQAVLNDALTAPTTSPGDPS